MPDNHRPFWHFPNGLNGRQGNVWEMCYESIRFYHFQPLSANAIIMVLDMCFMVGWYHILATALCCRPHYIYTTNLLSKCCQFVLGNFSIRAFGSHFGLAGGSRAGTYLHTSTHAKTTHTSPTLHNECFKNVWRLQKKHIRKFSFLSAEPFSCALPSRQQYLMMKKFPFRKKGQWC